MTNRTFLWFTALVPLAALLLVATPVGAQGADPNAVKQPSKTVRAMFNSADRNADGNLTREEARGRLPLTYRDFAKIDAEKKGSISFEQFMTYTNQRVAKQADDIVHFGDKY